MYRLPRHSAQLLLLLAATFAVPAQVNGQYSELPIASRFDPDQSDKWEKTVNTFRQRKNRILKGSEPFAQGRKIFEEYYRKFLFPAMTRRSTRGLAADLRREVVDDLAVAVPEARAVLYPLVVKYGKTIVAKNYHPGARYNFLLLLGQLNSKEASNNQPPVPDAAQLKYLRGSLASEKVPPILKYAAVLGLQRHAELRGHPKAPSPFDAKTKAQIAGPVAQVAFTNPGLSGEDRDANDWLRTRCVETLGHLRFVGQDNAVVTKLAILIVDEEESLGLRCAAAEAAGRMAASLDSELVDDFIGRVTKLAVDCSQHELVRLFEIQRSGPGGRRGISRGEGARREGGGDSYAEGRPPEGRRSGEGGRRGGFDDQSDEIVDSNTEETRKRLLIRIGQIRNALAGNRREGVDGLVVLLGGDTTKIDPVVALVDNIKESVENIETSLRSLGAELSAARVELAALVPATLGAPDDEEEAVEADSEPEQDS